MLDARMKAMNIDTEHYSWVSRSAPLRHRAACGLRPRLRTHDGLCDRPRQCARRDPISAHLPRQRALLRAAKLPLKDLFSNLTKRGNRNLASERQSAVQPPLAGAVLLSKTVSGAERDFFGICPAIRLRQSAQRFPAASMRSSLANARTSLPCSQMLRCGRA